MSESEDSDSILNQLDKIAPESLRQFDAFPKLDTTYKARSESRGFLTIFVALLSLLLVLNDIGEWVWGWPEYRFGLDRDASQFMTINADIVVNMPCAYLSVDLKDAIGDRLYLSKGFTRDGTFFDVGQATQLKKQSAAVSAKQVIAQSRKSRGFFSTLFGSYKSSLLQTYTHKPDEKACRVHGSVDVKKVTANLHITTLGHGYTSAQHVDHKLMNLSHVINDFSFGPYFPEITQPLDHSFEITHHPFIAYQYFLSVVPTTYIASRSAPLQTNQYSVTHYTRVLEHERGTPGIFFKFDLEPLNLTIHQRTTTFLQLLIRCVGVVGGVFCCMSWAVRIGYKAMEVASGADKTSGIVAAETTGIKKKWGGGNLRSRVTRQGSSWIVEGASPYGSYAPTPMSATFSPPPSAGGPHSPSPSFSHVNGHGLGLQSPNAFGPPPPTPGHRRPASINVGRAANVPLPPTPSGYPAASPDSPYNAAPMHGRQISSPYFPPSPAGLSPMNGVHPVHNGFPRSPLSENGVASGLNSPMPGNGTATAGPPFLGRNVSDEKKKD